jgi:hypothetical protein
VRSAAPPPRHEEGAGDEGERGGGGLDPGADGGDEVDDHFHGAGDGKDDEGRLVAEPREILRQSDDVPEGEQVDGEERDGDADPGGEAEEEADDEGGEQFVVHGRHGAIVVRVRLPLFLTEIDRGRDADQQRDYE